MKQTEIELILRAEKTIDQLNEVKAAIENNIVESEKLRETNEKGFKGLKGTLKNAQTGIKKLAKGFSGAGLAAKGFVLALGAKIFDTFLDIAKQNQVVVDALGVAFGTVSSVVNQVVDGLTNAVKSVNEATGGFNALGKVLKNVILIPLNIVKTQFFAIQKGLLMTQAAWEMSFLGGKDPEKIAELNTKLEEVDANLKNAAGSLVDNVKNIGDGFGQAIEEYSDQ